MSVFQTILVFGLIPLSIFAVIVVATRGSGSGDRRYRPDLPFDFVPVWFLAPEHRDGVSSTAVAKEFSGSSSLPQGGAHGNW